MEPVTLAPVGEQHPSAVAAFDARMRAEQIALLIAGTLVSIPASLAVAGALAYVQWPVIESRTIIAWLGALLLVSLLRAGLAIAYPRARAQDDPRWLPAFMTGIILAGAVWGAGAWLLYPPDAVAHQAFLGVLVAGLTAGAVTSLSASLAATLAFLALALLPLAVRFFSSDQEVIVALGPLTLLFAVVTAQGARRINANVVQNIRLRLRSGDQLAALEASEARASKLAMVAARTDNAVIITDARGRVEWVNEGFTRITGYHLTEVVGRTPGSVLQGPGTDAKVVQRMRERLRCGRGFQEEVLNFTNDGRPYLVSMEIQPIQDAAGKISHFMAVERDVTDSRRRQRQLEKAKRKAEEASRAKTDFLALMSHEIRTPLNGVLGALGLLQDTVLDAEQRKFVETSRHSAEWLLSIINNILDFSKMEAGKIELEPARFKLPGLVESVVEMLQPRADEKGIAITAEIDPGVPETLEGDATKIRQVLLNLASNSVKFTAHGEVCIQVSLLQRSERLTSLRFDVRDTGPGIDPEEQQKIFDEFWTRSENRTFGREGTGLGLSISRRLVRIMGGEIDFESRSGAGSRFWFDIPIGADPQPTEPVPAVPDAGEGPRSEPDICLKGRVLLAEDNPANQMIAQSLLQRLGLTVDVAANGLEAVDAVRIRPYDLVLMDISMPEMDGIAATQAIRALPGSAGCLPIVAVTAHVMRGERETLLARGLDDYLQKPIDRQALLACLNKWLTAETTEVQIPDPIVAPEPTPDANSVIDQSILDQLLEDVGAENAEVVVDAFVQELERQQLVLQQAAEAVDLAAMAAAAHRLKSSTASFGATPLSRVVADIEQAARSGQTETALGSMEEFRGLARSSERALRELRTELFGAAKQQ